MALTTFYKRPSSEYNSTTYGSSIFSCSDTGEAYLFGSKIKIKWEDVINPPTIGSAVAWSDITGKPSWIDSSTKPSYNWSEIGGKHSTFTPSSHTHTASQVSGLAGVATSGDYNDLSNKPTIPSLSGYATQSWVQSQGYITTAYSLPTASATVLGGVKVGAGLTISSAGVLSATGGGTADSVDWDNITSKPSWIDSTSKPSYSWSEISGKPSSFTPSAHTHSIGDITGIGTITFTGAVSATYNGTNDITVNIPTAGGGVADSVDWSNVTNKPSWIGSSKPSYSWSEVSSKPSTFTPSAHTHDFDEINFGNTGSSSQYLAGNGNFYTIAYSEISGTPDLSQYATKSYVEEVVGQGGSVDLSNYVTLDGTQTITGTKTFTQYTVFSNGAGTSSDERLKKSIKPIENPFEILEGLTGYRYTLISNNAKSVGLIAQDVEKVLPEAVRTDNEGYKSVDTYPIVAVLVETIKELKKEIEELKSKL